MTTNQPVVSWAARLVLLGLKVYQVVGRPFLAGSGSCRFVPTCSEYAVEAVERHGALRGSLMAARRLLRCHPLGSHGFDPPPGHSISR
jgi:uncharacterized protein